MRANQLTDQLKPGVRISIEGKNFKIVQHIVWWQAKAKSTYDKYALENQAGDKSTRLFIADGVVGLATLIHHNFQEPLPKELEYQGKRYKMTNDEFCFAEKVEGEEIYKQGEAEVWWDFVDLEDENKGLSLGRSWESWNREDLAYQIIKPEDVTFK